MSWSKVVVNRIHQNQEFSIGCAFPISTGTSIAKDISRKSGNSRKSKRKTHFQFGILDYLPKKIPLSPETFRLRRPNKYLSILFFWSLFVFFGVGGGGGGG